MKETDYNTMLYEKMKTEQELTEKTERLSVLNGLLNVDKRENEIVDGEIDEGEEVVPERKDKESVLER